MSRPGDVYRRAAKWLAARPLDSGDGMCDAIAAMWAPIFGGAITEQQVVLAMIALKVARAINTPRHRDHWVDIAGYVALAERAGLVAAP